MQSSSPWVDWNRDSKDKQTWGEVLREMLPEKGKIFLKAGMSCVFEEPGKIRFGRTES